jgi:hypothetical protein
MFVKFGNTEINTAHVAAIRVSLESAGPCGRRGKTVMEKFDTSEKAEERAAQIKAG